MGAVNSFGVFLSVGLALGLCGRLPRPHWQRKARKLSAVHNAVLRSFPRRWTAPPASVNQLRRLPPAPIRYQATMETRRRVLCRVLAAVAADGSRSSRFSRPSVGPRGFHPWHFHPGLTSCHVFLRRGTLKESPTSDGNEQPRHRSSRNCPGN